MLRLSSCLPAQVGEHTGCAVMLKIIHYVLILQNDYVDSVA